MRVQDSKVPLSLPQGCERYPLLPSTDPLCNLTVHSFSRACIKAPKATGHLQTLNPEHQLKLCPTRTLGRAVKRGPLCPHTSRVSQAGISLGKARATTLVSMPHKKEGNLHHRAEGKASAGEEKERGAKTGVRRKFYLLHASAMQVRRTLRAQKGSTKTEEWGKGSVKELGLIFPLLF